jgi:hypothetical protein
LSLLSGNRNKGEDHMQEGNRSSQMGSQESVTEYSIGERRLWLAVLMQAVEDWRGGTLRARRKAQEFIFGERHDFEMVCANAGLDADNLRSKLLRVGHMVAAQGSLSHPLAA